MVAASAYLLNACTFSQTFSLTTALKCSRSNTQDQRQTIENKNYKNPKMNHLYRGSLRELKPCCGTIEDASLLKKKKENEKYKGQVGWGTTAVVGEILYNIKWNKNKAHGRDRE